MKNIVLNEDLLHLAEQLKEYDFSDKRILITGITGFIGSLFAKALITLKKKTAIDVEIIGIARDLDIVSNVFGESQESLTLVIGDVTNSELYKNIPNVDYILHTASPTTSKYFISNPVETIHTIYQGTKNVLELAKECSAKSVVFVSSMEVYGVIDTENKKRIDETMLGTIDVLNVRSSYSEGKRLAETLCKSYQEEYRVPVKIARLAQTFGPGVRKDDNRVYMQFAKSVISNTPIILHTEGESFGNYCYSRDAISALALLLFKGEDGNAYNVVDESSTQTISEMAHLVASKVANDNIEVVYDIPKGSGLGYAPQTGLRLSGSKLSSLGWKPEIGLKEAYKRLIQYLEFELR